MPILCILLLLLSFTCVVHGTYTILDTQISLSSADPDYEISFDLPAGDNITIWIVMTGGPIDFHITNGTHIVYNGTRITSLDDVWTVPRNDTYNFEFLYIGEPNAGVRAVLGSEIIPEFPIWTSMLLVLITLTVAIAIYKRRLLRTPIH